MTEKYRHRHEILLSEESRDFLFVKNNKEFVNDCVLYTVLGTNPYRAPGRLPCVENPGMNSLEGAVLSMVRGRIVDASRYIFNF